ncbi:MAG: hypothetical protein ACI4PF_00800 [Christensenellales bacterium]
MEEFNKIGEQPNTAEVQAVATELSDGTEMRDGSPLGKFKNPEKLLDAYNELQSEFTRKCQKLSDAEKKLQEFNSNNDASNIQSENSNEFVWKNKISEFLQSHKNASELVEDITNEIINDEALKSSEDGLEKAYSRVIEKKFIPQSELVNNQEFLEKYIYSNDKIKNKIIQEYVSALQNTKSPITVSNSGFSRGVAGNSKFESLEDARQYVENMFRF